ncbi:acyl-CoA dehydrogenase family protein [Halomarina pelagica]|uniref:acyl-CoA dehydrogenase family protein n=1 Tax=Halomarina pelagica TaxID=2961599 RepID=UPI0020C40912|nr:acyl-CoA dehydrogenase family protein [Halomarina sp. BND7]
MQFGFTETQRLLKRTARNLAERELATDAFTWEGAYPWENAAKLADAGLLGIALSEEHGGGGLTPLEVLLVQEEIGRVCPDSAHVVSKSSMGAPRAVDVLGSDYLRETYLPPVCAGESVMSIAISEAEAGSAAGEMTTAATDDGDEVVLNGRKLWVTQADVADAFLVYVRFPEGIGAVVVDRDAPGFEEGERYTNMGGETQSELVFDDCRLPDEQVLVRGEDAFVTLLKTFNVERCHNAMICVSMARNAFERTIEYATDREQFGRPIAEFQAIQHKLADMAIQIETARLAVLYAAATADTDDGLATRAQTSIAKVYANEVGERVLTEALQVHGANGYAKGHPVEYMYRKIRGWKIAGGTVEIHRNGIAGLLLEEGYDP